MTSRAQQFNSLAKLLLPNVESFTRLDNFKLTEVPKGFVNLTPYDISSQMAAILSYGPRFMMPRRASAIDFMDDFGQLNSYLIKYYGILDPSQMFLELFTRQKAELDTLFKGNQLSIVEIAIRDACKEVHEFFTIHPEVAIVQSDKGNKTCLMLRADYATKMRKYVEKCISRGIYRLATENEVVKAKDIYVQLKTDILSASSQDLKHAQIPERLFYWLRSTTAAKSQLPHLYGTVKCHKEEAPMRPICSTIKWISRPIQQLLLHILKTCFSSALCSQNVLRMEDVAKKLASYPLKDGHVFVKMDVCDMYGSMHKPKIKTTLMRLFANPLVQQELPISVSLLQRLVDFSLETSCFVQFEGLVYSQVRGLPQGASDSGFLATLHLDSLLQIHSDELFTVHQVKSWWKYMDDILLYMPVKNVASFHKTLERITDLKFEIEYEEELGDHPLSQFGLVKTISFLDLRISHGTKGPLLVNRYTKSIASQRMIHALSTTVYNYKINALKGFLYRILRRTSNRLLVYDLNKFYEQAAANGYPSSLLDQLYHNVLNGEIQKLNQGGTVLNLPSAQLDARMRIMRAILPDVSSFSPEVLQVMYKLTSSSIINLCVSQYLDTSLPR